MGDVHATSVLKDSCRLSICDQWKVDVCGQLGLDDCLIQKVFENQLTHKSDLLITKVGIMYTLLDPDGVANIAAWRIDLVRMFIVALNRDFRGTVIRMTGSKQKHRFAPGEGNFKKDPDFVYADLRTQQLDLQITPIFQRETNWTIYDGYHVTEPLAYVPGYFADPIHPPGRLTQVGWEYILGYDCPTAPPTHLIMKIFAYHKHNHHIDTCVLYLY